MVIKRLLSAAVAALLMTTVAFGTVQASYTVTDAKTEWNLTDISASIEDYATDETGVYDYNGLILHMGSGGSISERGLIGNKNGGYVEFTAPSDGTLAVVADMNAGAVLYCDTSTSTRSNKILEASADTEKMPGSTSVTANAKYYIYNGTSNAHKIKSVTFTPKTQPSEEEPAEFNGQYIHMSFDDVYLCLQDLTTNASSYSSVFDSPFFVFLKELHDNYGAVFSLYCFNTASGWDISNVTDKFQSELAANSDWLKFGFHAEDADANYGVDDGGGTYGTAKGDCPEELAASYTKFLASVKKLTGNDFESVDHISRLGFFGGTKTNIQTLKSLGMTGFLGADSTSRYSYYLDDIRTLYNNGIVEDTEENILFLVSQSRLESVAKVEATTAGSVDAYLTRIENLKDVKVIELFTHEGRWIEERTKNMIEYYLSWAKTKGYGFDYAQNVYEKYAPIKVVDPNELVEAEKYDLTTITDKIEYDETAFRNGTPYEYEGLKIVGGNTAAKIDNNGVKLAKYSNGQMYFEYVPSKSGTLKIEITAGHSGSNYSKVYADESLGSRTNLVIDASADGSAEGIIEVTAGKTYYIYNASSAPTIFRKLTLLTDPNVEEETEITLNNMYGDNMMFQHGVAFALNGKYKNVTTATASLVNNSTNETEQTAELLLNRKLTWTAEFEAVNNYSDTYTIKVTADGEETPIITVSNVIFGDVYLLGGQSNTVRELGYYKNLGLDYDDIEVINTNIRMLDITGGRKVSGDNTGELKSSVPCDEFVVSDNVTYEVSPEWTDFNSELNFNSVSALAYSFVTKLYEETNIPVGIISTGYDGTEIAQWLPNNGTNFYNSRIYPFRVFNLKGILWYQGESDRNMDTPLETYKEKFTTLVHHYRELFANEEDVPFYYVAIPRTSGSATDPQNPEIGASANAKLAYIRQAQTEVYTELSETESNFGIVPTLDVYGNKNYDAPNNGETENGNNRKGFHTGQKPVIAQRLVNWVLKDLYGQETDAIGPVYRSGISKNGKITLTYESKGDLTLLNKDTFTDSHAESVFEANNIDETVPQEFEIAGEDGIYYRAKAVIDGNKVTLSNENVTEPVYFRYAQNGYNGDTYIECPNLTDESGLPALVTAARVRVSDGEEYENGMTLSEDGTKLIITAKEDTASVTLVRAVYNSGVLEEASVIESVTSLNRGINEVEIAAEEENKTVRFFLWNSLDKMEPICGSI